LSYGFWSVSQFQPKFRITARLLAGESTVSLTGGTLVLASPRGVLRFTR
jgi:hypothetical protein